MALHLLCILPLNTLHGQEVRRAIQLTQEELTAATLRFNEEQQRASDAEDAEQRSIEAEGNQNSAKWARVNSWPTSWQQIGAMRLLNEEQAGLNARQKRNTARLHDLKRQYDRRMAAAEQWRKTTRKMPDPYQDFIDAVDASRRPAVAATPTLKATPTRSDQKDCLIVATEAYARLQKSAYWAKIAGFTWSENTKVIGGHAVVFYQPTENTNVFMYDESGSFDLQTRSHDLNEIITALNRLTRKVRVESPRWLESDDSRTQFASEASTEQPVWANTGAMSPEQIGELIGRLIGLTMILAGYAYLIVICFLKGKPGFGALGILGFFLPVIGWVAIIGATRIAKPDSWWARKYYGPEKMNIAHQRFTPLYKEENMQQTTTRVIAREWLTFVISLVIGLTVAPLILSAILFAIFGGNISNLAAFFPLFYGSFFALKEHWLICWSVAFAPYIIYQFGCSVTWAVKTAKGR